METLGFPRRIVAPTAWVLGTMLVSRILYFNTSGIAATVAGIPMFLALAFGTCLVYPVAFFRGASLVERIAGCLVTPFVWNAIEIYNVGQAFTPAESLFYGLNILFIGAVASQFVLMGISDLACRLVGKARGVVTGRPLSPFATLSLAGGLFGVYMVLFWGEGVGLHYLLIDLYKKLFL